MTTEARGFSSAMRRWRRWATMLAIFAIAIPGAARALIRNGQAGMRLRTLATEAIRSELGLDASLGPVQLELVPLALVARDVSVGDPIYGRLADVELVRIRPSLFSLVRGSVDLAAVELEGAQVHLVFRDGAVRNLPRLEAEGGGDVTLPFRALTIRDSTFSIDASPYASAEVSGVSGTVRGQPGGVIDVSAEALAGWVEHAGGRDELARPDGSAFHAHVEVGADMLRAEEFALGVGPLLVEGNDVMVPLPLRDPRVDSGYRGEVAIRYDLTHLATLPLPFTLPPMQGDVDVRVRAYEERDVQRATGSVRIQGGQILEFGIGEVVRLEIEADPDTVRVTRGESFIIHNGGRVGIEATLGLSRDLPLEARATLHDLSFARLMDELGVTPNSIVEWMFDGQMVLRGSLRNLAIEGPIELYTRDFAVLPGPYHSHAAHPVLAMPRGTFRGRWSIRDDAVRFTSLVGELPHSRIEGDVVLGFHNELRVSARARGDLVDVSPLAGFPMAGDAQVRCEVDGVYQDPRVTGHIDATGFEWNAMRLGDISSDAVLDRDGLGVTFPHVEVHKGASEYSAENLYLDFHAHRFRMTSMFRFARMHLSDFYDVFDLGEDERFTSYQGVLHGAVDTTYTNGFPNDSPTGTLDTRIDATFSHAELSGFAFDEGRLLGAFRWLDWSRGMDAAELSIEHASLRKGRGTVTLDGTMTLGGALRMSAAVDAIELRDIEGIGDRLPGLDGVASATASVGGTVDLMRVDMDVGVTNVVWASRSLGDGRAYVRMTHSGDAWVQDALAWEGSPPAGEPCALSRRGLAQADWPADPPMRTREGPRPRLSRPSAFLICGSALDGAVDIDLAIGRTTRFPLRGRVAVRDFDASIFLPSHEDRARVTGEAIFERGGFVEPETLMAMLRISELELARGDVAFVNRGPVVLAMKDGAVSIERARFRGPGSRVRAQGEWSIADGLALSVDGSIDLDVVSRIYPQLVPEAHGTVEARLALTGPLSDPAVFGEANLRGGEVRLSALSSPITELDASVTFSARSIQIESVRGRVAGGRVSASGEATLADGRVNHYAVDIDADGLDVAAAEGLEMTLSASTELSWDRGERLPRLAGELRVDRFLYERPIDLGFSSFVGTIGDMSRTQRATVSRYDPSADRVAIDLHVVHDLPLLVRNNLAEAELRIDDSRRPFRIVGTDQRFGVLGNLEFARGRVFFRNAAFDLRRGSISFDDESRIWPSFDVTALTEIRRSGDLTAPSWRITLNALGTLDAFSIQTRSEPDLPQEDVLTLLAAGLTRSELSQLQEGQVGSSLAIEALTQVTGVDREIRRALPQIDDFRVTTAYSVRTQRTEPQISIGKRIADRVRLSATTGLSEAREFRTVLEIQLTPEVSAQCSYDNFNLTTASSFGNVGCDLRWRLEFE